MKETKDTQKMQDDAIDLSVDTIKKKRFRINGDPNAILELHTSDINIIPRLKEGYDRLMELSHNVAELDIDTDTDEGFDQLAEELKKLDAEMRKELDKIFDAPVSEVCAPVGSIYDIKNGKFQFEYIIEALAPLYDNDFRSEFSKMRKNISSHTSKYTKRKK